MRQLFRLGRLWSGDPEIGQIRDAFLLTDGDKIEALGEWKHRPRAKKFRLIEKNFKSHACLPGMINLHGHLAMTLLKGLGENVELHSWLHDYIFPAEKKWVTPQMVKVGTELALCESIRAGVTLVTDMYYYSEVSAKLIDAYGLRGLIGRSFFEEGGWDVKNLDESLTKSKKLIKGLKRNKRLEGILAPHAPYTCSVQTLKQTAELAKELDCGVMIHTSETKKELVDIKRQTGVSPVALLDQTGILNKARYTLAIHSVWLEDSDFRILARPNVSCIINARCNSKIASGFPPISKMKAAKVRFALGTDSAVTNNTLDLFSEMDFLVRANRLMTGSFSEITGHDLLLACTLRAAEAIGLSDRIGSLRPQKQADFILVDLNQAHLQPCEDLESTLVFGARASDVTHSFVAGKPLMINREIKVCREQKVLREAEEMAAKIWTSLKFRRA